MSTRDDALLWVGVTSKPRPIGPSHRAPLVPSTRQEEAQRGSTSFELKRVDGQQLCARLLSYVMSRELGGVHNAVTEADESELHSEEHDAATALRLEVELARPTQAALTSSCTHVVRYEDQRGQKGDGGVRLINTSSSFMRVADEVASFRKQLHTCWNEIDVSGGITDGLPPAVRERSMRIVEHGLRGEQPQKKRARDDVGTLVIEAPASQHRATASAHLLSLLQDSDEDGEP
jgi:hypothetical protein